MQTLLREVTTYWSRRSSGYCRVNENELASFKSQAWTDIIREHCPWEPGDRLRVLDAGTGPGFLALVMAGCGHRVIGVDCTGAMLEKARVNAENQGCTVDFKAMDVHHLDFEENSFDLVLSRNLTWNLEDPEQVYREFYRVLAPGGRLLNFDANWYLHLHDPLERRNYEQDRRNARERNCPDHYTCTDTTAMERIASDLPLSRIRRPEWDARILGQAGYKNLVVKTDVGSRLWDREEKINYASTPMFMVCAEK